MSKRTRGWLPVVFLAGALAACENAMEPDPATFDAEAALEDYRALDGILGTQGWKGFVAMGGAVSLSSFDPGIDLLLASARPLRTVRDAADARAFAQQLLATAATPLQSAASPIISPVNRGRTFVYDATRGRYVIDPKRTGAPATGVRLIVYAETAGKPDPSREIGYADLIDEGDGSATDIALRLVVVSSGRTILDYRTTLDDNAGRGRITVDGFLRGEGEQLDFEIDVAGSSTGGRSTFDVAFRMAVESRAFVIDGAVHGVQQGEAGTGDVDVSVRHGDASLRVDLTGTQATIAGTVYLNGGVFVKVAGRPEKPEFTRPDGSALTGAEMLVLLRVVDIVEDVFDLYEDLLDPIDELVILAIIL